MTLLNWPFWHKFYLQRLHIDKAEVYTEEVHVALYSKRIHYISRKTNKKQSKSVNALFYLYK